MNPNRLEAFSDGVIAILITIMVLGLEAPEDGTLSSVKPLLPTFLSYILSFVYIGIYWNNHHHLLRTTKKVTAAIMWSNHHLMFWLSLIPSATHWVGKEHNEVLPAMTYAFILFMSSIAYFILQRNVFESIDQNSRLKEVTKDYKKPFISMTMYAVAIVSALLSTWLTYFILAVLAVIWLIPDRKIEQSLMENN